MNARELSLQRTALPSILAACLSQDIRSTRWVPPMPRQHAAAICHMSLAVSLVEINFCVLKKGDLCSQGTPVSKGKNDLCTGVGRSHRKSFKLHLKKERDKTQLDGDKPGGSTPVFER